MNRITMNFENRANRRLYCVWIAAPEGSRTPLVSVWINPTMAQFERECRTPAQAALAADASEPVCEPELQCS